MFTMGRKLSILLVSLLTPVSVVFSPIVSYSTPPTTFQTLNSPTRLWLMTPEDDERCRQDTERYNAAWTAAWYASHPGHGPAPTPTPPYVCPPPPPDNSPAPVTPTPVTPNKPIVPGTNQGTGLPNELDNKPGNTPELNTGLGKPGEYKPGYDPATGLPVNEAEQANPNSGDPNDPQTGELARRIAENDAYFNNIPNNGRPIVPANIGPGEPVHQPGQPIVPANVGPNAPKPAPSKPEIISNKPVDSGSYTPPANNQPQDTGSLNPEKKPVEKVENNDTSAEPDDGTVHSGYDRTTGKPTDKVKYWGNEMSRAESDTCGSDKFDCMRSRDSAPIAEEESSKYFPGKKTDDNQQDAARHCIWLALMTEMANEDFARKMANAHEEGAAGGDGTDSGRMDKFNNETGIAVGKRHEGDRKGIINECVTLARGAQITPPSQIPNPADSKGDTLVILTDRREN